MTVLYERFYRSGRDGNISSGNDEAEKAHALFCIYHAILGGSIVQADPERMIIKENGEVEQIYYQGWNAYYAAPEVVINGSKPDMDSGWFTLGLAIYFVLHGRSYYEDRHIRLVDLPERMKTSRCLIPARFLVYRESDAPLLYRKAMGKLTAWNPMERAEGIPFFLDAVMQYLSDADIECICGGVEGGQTQQRLGERYLFIQESAAGNMTKLMKLGSIKKVAKAEVLLDTEKRYIFYTVTGNPQEQSVIETKKIYHLDVPVSRIAQRALLQITYTPGAGCEVAIYNREGTKMISDNTKSFFV